MKNTFKAETVISVMAFIISILTLLLTSPITIDYYFKPNVVYSARELTDGALEITIENTGKRDASNLTIELAPRHPQDYTEINISSILLIPPKEYEITSQNMFKIIKISSPLPAGETIKIYVNADIPHRAYPHLWICVRFEGKEAVKRSTIKLIEDDYFFK